MKSRRYGRLRFLQGLNLGLLASLISVILLLYFEVGPELFLVFENYVFALVALFAAFLSVSSISAQILVEVEAREDARSRRISALRGILAVRLSSAIFMARSVSRWYCDPLRVEVPEELDAERELLAMADFIEVSPGQAGDYINSCIHIFQVLVARLSEDRLYLNAHSVEAVADRSILSRLDSAAIDWMILSEMLSNLLRVARGEVGVLEFEEIDAGRLSGGFSGLFLEGKSFAIPPPSVLRIYEAIAMRQELGSVLPVWMREVALNAPSEQP